MVRHEAAEALGAIALPECLAQLEKYEHDCCREVAETCQLALCRIRYWQEKRLENAADESNVSASKGSKKELFAAQPGQQSGEDSSPYLSGATLHNMTRLSGYVTSYLLRTMLSGSSARGTGKYAAACAVCHARR